MFKYDKAEMASDLKQMRIEAGLTQKELADRIGLSRETVVAIENKHQGTIATLKMETVKRWFRACKSHAHSSLLTKFRQGITSYFGI